MAEEQKRDKSNKKNSSRANAHDKRYKRLFSNPHIVEELMKYFVDVDFVKELDFSTLERQDKSFVNDEHKQSESDMIWKINFKGKDVYIYLLIEFQSGVDKYMALRFGSYIFEFYKWLSLRKDIDLLPAVFPILIYNGDGHWTAKDNIKDLIIGSIPEEYIPSFRYYKIIENEIPKEKLIKIHNALSMVFYAETITAEELKNSINQIFDLLKDELPELLKEFSIWLNNLFITSGYDMEDMSDTIDRLKNMEEVRTMLTTALKEHEEKHELIGIKKGMLEAALNMLKLGMEVEVITKVTGLSVEEIKKLKQN